MQAKRTKMDMPASLPFSKSFDFASGATGERFQNPFWKLKEFVLGAPLRKAVFDVKVFGNSIVSAAIKKRQNESGLSKNDIIKNSDPRQNNLINSLLDHIDDHQVVADAAMNYLSAGKCALESECIIANLCFREGHNSSVFDLDILSLNAPSECTKEYLVRVAFYLR